MPGETAQRISATQFFLAFLFCGIASAQQTSTRQVTFTLDFPGSEPGHYTITVGADCQASYVSDGKLNFQSDANTFHNDFVLSRAKCDKVFELTKRAKYFSGELDSKKKNIAATGRKTLAYEDGTTVTKAAYNYSSRLEVEELTSLFQGLSMTLELEHRLEYFYKYQKLSLSDELTRVEQMAKQNDIADLALMTSILRKIGGDSTVMNGVRSRAQRLLAMAADGNQ